MGRVEPTSTMPTAHPQVVLILVILSLSARTIQSCEYHICSSEYAELLTSRQLAATHESQPDSSDDQSTNGQSTNGQSTNGQSTNGSHEPSGVKESSPQSPSPHQSMSKEQTEYCNLLNAYNQCMKTQSKGCRGNMNYHAIVAMVKKWLKEGECSGRRQGVKSRQGVRSHVSLFRKEQESRRREEESRRREEESRRKKEQLQRKLDICFMDALNYTLDPLSFTLSRRHFKHVKVIDDTSSVSGFPLHSLSDNPMVPVGDSVPLHSLLNDNPMVPVGESDGGLSVDDGRRMGRSQDFSGHQSISQQTGEVTSSDLSSSVHDSSGGSARTGRSHEPDLRSLPPPISGDGDSSNAEDGDASKVSESEEEETENLLCLLYGDPHLRTFTGQFMTCRCLGAWPLIDHPLFAVQVTHTKGDDGSGPSSSHSYGRIRSQISGVSKVTVLVRRFTSCGINTDLMYEADARRSHGASSRTSKGDSSNGGTSSDDDDDDDDDGHFPNDTSLPVSFIDGSINTPNNMIRIVRSSIDGPEDEVCIHLEHISVQVCINQLIGGLSPSTGSRDPTLTPVTGSRDPTLASVGSRDPTLASVDGSRYLNVMVKLKNPMTKRDRDSIIASLSPSSLCRVGCPSRERIDIESILHAAGFTLFDTLHPASHLNQQGNSHLNQQENIHPPSHLNQQGNGSILTSTLPECDGLYGYYLLSCLFDVKMKGLTSSHVHRSSQSKDHQDMALIHKCYIDSRTGHSFTGSTSSLSVHFSFILMSIVLIVSNWFFRR